jgi:hypothetical protein
MSANCACGAGRIGCIVITVRVIETLTGHTNMLAYPAGMAEGGPRL